MKLHLINPSSCRPDAAYKVQNRGYKNCYFISLIFSLEYHRNVSAMIVLPSFVSGFHWDSQYDAIFFNGCQLPISKSVFTFHEELQISQTENYSYSALSHVQQRLKNYLKTTEYSKYRHH